MRTWWKKLVDLALATYVVLGFGSPFGLIAGGSLLALGRGLGGAGLSMVALPVLVMMFFGVAWAYKRIRERGRGPFRVAVEVLALGVLPLWGMLLNHLLPGSCTLNSCQIDDSPTRLLAEPEVFGALGLHLVSVLAYTISRRRPEALPPRTEAAVHGGMLAGIVLQTLVGVQFLKVIPMGLMIFPIAQPVLAPFVTLLLFGSELRARLRRRGAETPREPSVRPVGYRTAADGGPAVPSLNERVRPADALRAAGAGTVIVGVHAVVQGLWLHHVNGALQVFTRTCTHPLSHLALHVTPRDCHYLCTVAARGHTWLVRPERMGVRGGVAIVVNRQLAVANAFEDLLHTQWPRFGRFARATYDALGMPVSRWIRWRWLADLVYLAMKPAEWCFYVALLVLDPTPPEGRIDRMYR